MSFAALYDDPDRSDRFLVADEVGLGKTLVARGVIAGAIERLQNDPSVRRIDVIYICSNAEIARQNIAKLDVRGDGSKPLSTRITMMATQLRDLNRRMADGSKTVNLVAFTPGTSFDKGQRGGRVEERALLSWLLRPVMTGTRAERNALQRILRMDVSEASWDWACQRLDDGGAPPDADVARKFRDVVVRSPVMAELRQLVDEMRGRYKFNENQSRRRRAVIGSLRRLLAEVSVACLEPDLVILDEFQRFKHLLDPPETSAEREVSELANALFTAENVKILLLSATPYKMFTLAEELELTGDDHYTDFIAIVDFLECPRQAGTAQRLMSALAEFRRRAITGKDPRAAKDQVEDLLRKVMCRTERPISGIADMLITKANQPQPPTTADLLGFVAMKEIADRVGGTLSVEYWKSAPYFLNFMDGYQLSQKFRLHQLGAASMALHANAQVIDSAQLNGTTEIEPGNARLRQLQSETLDRGLWRLLWMPPSMPYHQPAGPYRDIDPGWVTKRLTFSSWAAAPTAIASLLSWTATRRMHGSDHGDRPTRPRLVYRMESERPAGMTTLALFLPTPGLAALTDPLDFARLAPGETLPAERALAFAEARVAPRVGADRRASAALSPDTWLWAAPFAVDGGVRQAAAVIAAGFRSLFNRPEVMALLDRQAPDLPYWQAVLEYCHGGNLQAVVDEYLHHLIGNESPATDDDLITVAKNVRAALALRTGPLQGFDPSHPDAPLHFNTRFALRYGTAKGAARTDDKSLERMSDVQAAFNSPFWLMILASTSIGQEGVDLHWWCHSLIHWNLPANPVDFEQREGRVHRFKGHAVRKNVGAAHRAEALQSGDPDPWAAAFAAAEHRREPGMNDLWPWWAYPGDAKIERWVPSFPLSKDQQREERLQRQRALYRLAFGQPRQEDLLTILDQYRYDDERIVELRIDLRPPNHEPPGDSVESEPNPG